MTKAIRSYTIDSSVTALSFEGANVRLISRSEEPWWVLSDVCEILNIHNPRNVTAKLDPDEKGVQIMDTLGGPQETTIINESGLYSLILTSRKPAAKRFKKWVTSEVLPAIRKTGGYAFKQTSTPRLRRPSVLRTFKTAIEIGKLVGLEDSILSLHAAQYCKAKCGENPLELMGIKTLPAAASERTLSPTEIGEKLELSAQRVNEILCHLGLQHHTYNKRRHRIYHLTEMGKLYGRLEDASRAHSDGSVTVLRWYPRVIDQLEKHLQAQRYPRLEQGLPVVEAVA